MQADPTVVYATDTMALDDLRLSRGPTTSSGTPSAWPTWRRVNVSPRAAVAPDLPERRACRTGPSPRPRGRRSRPPSTPTSARSLLFFYACPGSDTHTFARTAAQHAATSPSASRSDGAAISLVDARIPTARPGRRRTPPIGALARRRPGGAAARAWTRLRERPRRGRPGRLLRPAAGERPLPDRLRARATARRRSAARRAASSCPPTRRSSWPTRATACRPARSARTAALRTSTATFVRRLAGAAGQPARASASPDGRRAPRRRGGRLRQPRRVAGARGGRAGRGARARRGPRRGRSARVKEPAELERVARRLRRRRRGAAGHAGGHPAGRHRARAGPGPRVAHAHRRRRGPRLRRRLPVPARVPRCPMARPARAPCAPGRCCCSTSGRGSAAIAPT